MSLRRALRTFGPYRPPWLGVHLEDGTTAHFNAGSATVLDNVDTGTLVWLTYSPASAIGRALYTKGRPNSGGSRLLFRFGPAAISMRRDRSTDLVVAADGTAFKTAMAENVVMGAAVWSTGGVDGDQRLYLGDRSIPVEEPSSYTSQTVGSGTPVSNASFDAILLNAEATGGGVAPDSPFGAAFVLLHWNRQLTHRDLLQVQDCLFRGRLPDVLDPTCIGAWTFDSLKVARDHSRYGNHGVPSGITRHHLSRPYQARTRFWWVEPPAAGGSALVAVRTETAEVGENRLRLLGLVRTRTDTAEASEGQLRLLGLVRIRTELAEAGEQLLRLLGLVRIRSELAEAGETFQPVRGLVRLRGDAAEADESHVGIRGLVRLRDESAEASETRVSVRGLVRAASETAEAIESRLRTLGFVRVRTETAQSTETALRAMGHVRIRLDTANALEVLVRVLGLVRIRTESAEASESRVAVRGLVRIRTEVAQATEAVLELIALSSLAVFSATIELLPLFRTRLEAVPLFSKVLELLPFYRGDVDLEPEG